MDDSKPEQKQIQRRQTGRPPSYSPVFAEEARAMCQLGATDRDLADAFQVAIATIWRWSCAYPDFRSALKLGKKVADENVVRSLYQKAIGYSYDAVKIFMPAGAEEPIYAPYTEHVPPDTTAAIFWLKNRQPDKWRDQRNVEVNGELNLNAILGAILEASQEALPAPSAPGDGAVDVTPTVIDVEDEAAPESDESGTAE
jgi:hypothetical protein